MGAAALGKGGVGGRVDGPNPKGLAACGLGRATRLPTTGDLRKDLPVTVPKSTDDERLEVMRAVL